ncbi:MAG: hypothetical protein V4539_01760 [Bacteroidota bacterium]
MKKAIFIASVFVFILWGCKKDDGFVGPITTFHFTANGLVYQWDGSSALNSQLGSVITKSTSGFNYSLTPVNFAGNLYNKFLCTIALNSALTTGTYAVKPLAAECTLATSTSNTTRYELPSPVATEYVAVVLTKVENGYATGNFAGRLRQTGAGGSLEFSGEFTNVPIVQ